MATQRTLKLNLLADVDKFGKGLNKAGDDAKGFSGKVSKYGKVAAGALAGVAAAAGIMAIKIGIDGVKAAIEDEVSQKKLATTLKNVTKATDKQIQSAEEYITKQQISYGIADTKLRPALEILVRRTDDLTKAQELNNLAIDISAATGKDLETVATALGKAYGGNLSALKKLGIPLDETTIKTKDFQKAQKELTDTFGGSAYENTKTYEGQLKILNERWGELKEGIGQKAIPILKDLLEQVNLVSIGFSGEDQKKGLSNKVKALSNELDGKSGGIKLGESLATLAEAFKTMFSALSSPNGVKSADALENIANAINNIATAITNLSAAYKKIKPILDKLPSNIIRNKVWDFLTTPQGKAAGGSVMKNQAYRVGEFGSEIFVPSGSGSIRKDPGGGGGNTFIFNGVIDAQSARQSIERLLQTQSRISGTINLSGAMS
jgi:hypothetical protein